MLSHLFWIFFKPNRTLDRLLEERKNGQSWGVTWLLAGLTIASGLYYVWLIWDLFHTMVAMEGAEAPEMEFLLVMLGSVFGATVLYSLIFYPLSRYFFAWLVQLGLRMVAGDEYPADREERRENGLLLRLIQPYTAWVFVLPNLMIGLAVLLLMDMGSMMEQMQMAEMEGSGEMPAAFMGAFVGVMVLSVIGQIVQIGTLVYQVILRVMAIKKIYHVSTAKAFWGPALAYLIAYLLLVVLIVLVVVGVTMIGMAFDPSMNI